MQKVKHFTLGVAAAAMGAAALMFAPAASAAPSGHFDFTHSYTEDTGIVCGSGASSFDVIDSATVHKYGPSFSDENGNFVKDILFIDTVGTFSNSVTGASIQYKSRSIEHDSLAIPGDFNSTFTAVTTGEMNIVAPGQRGRLAGDRPRRRHVLSERRRDARLQRPARSLRLLLPRRDVCCGQALRSARRIA